MIISEEGRRNVTSFVKTYMKKIKVGVQVPAGGRPTKPGFLFSSGITTPYLKA